MRSDALSLKGLVRLMGIAVVGCLPLLAQAQGGQRAAVRGPPPWSKQLSGYWVSLITQNWRLRMVTPAKGDYIGIPLTAAAQKIADAWDPAKDAADGQQCRAYGAAGIMMRPERLHITQPDEATMQIDIDDGTQTRTLHFGGGAAPADFQPSWQGYSRARWVSRREYGATGANAYYLETNTTHMLPGYLRQNGVPYSANAVLVEAYELTAVSDQETYLTLTQTVTDPVYLDSPFILTAIFQKQPSDAGWNPTACSASW